MQNKRVGYFDGQFFEFFDGVFIHNFAEHFFVHSVIADGNEDDIRAAVKYLCDINVGVEVILSA